MTKLLLATALLSALTLDGCLDSQSCGGKLCWSGAELRLQYPSSVNDALPGGTLRVCRNELCNQDNVVGSGAGLSLGFPLDTHVRIVESSFQNQVVTVKIEPGAAGLKDGDLYSIELRDKNGALVGSKQWQATYQHTYPNGSDCDDGCAFVQLD